jgi:hypothetical protein
MVHFSILPEAEKKAFPRRWLRFAPRMNRRTHRNAQQLQTPLCNTIDQGLFPNNTRQSFFKRHRSAAGDVPIRVACASTKDLGVDSKLIRHETFVPGFFLLVDHHALSVEPL